MSLSEWMVRSILSESDIKNVVVIYPGRFQPMGRHHAAVYKKLASQFGRSNTYIATSDVVNPPKSPLNFHEKAQVMKAHGITNVVQVKNPYQSLEIVSKYDPETTAVLFAVGKKDMAEDPRFRVGPKKNGEPSYFQYYDEHKDELSQKHKSYYQEYKEHKHTEINQKSKVLQSKYREGYRILCKLIEDNAILPSYLNLEEIKKFIVQ